MHYTFIIWFTRHKVGTQILSDYIIYPTWPKIYFERTEDSFLKKKRKERGMTNCPSMFAIKKYQIITPGYYIFMLKAGSALFIRMPSDDFHASSSLFVFK